MNLANQEKIETVSSNLNFQKPVNQVPIPQTIEENQQFVQTNEKLQILIVKEDEKKKQRYWF